MHLSSPTQSYVPHVPSILFFSILSPECYFVRCAYREAPVLIVKLLCLSWSSCAYREAPVLIVKLLWRRRTNADVRRCPVWKSQCPRTGNQAAIVIVCNAGINSGRKLAWISLKIKCWLRNWLPDAPLGAWEWLNHFCKNIMRPARDTVFVLKLISGYSKKL
jgi:hypothetical protein